MNRILYKPPGFLCKRLGNMTHRKGFFGVVVIITINFREVNLKT